MKRGFIVWISGLRGPEPQLIEARGDAPNWSHTTKKKALAHFAVDDPTLPLKALAMLYPMKADQ